MIMLIPGEQRLLESIETFVDLQHYFPSCREMSAALNMKSPCGAKKWLDGLEQKGYVASTPGKKRARRLQIPVLGAIQAGSVVEHPADLVYGIPIPGIKPSQHYALQVCGDSMIDADIDDGDLIVLRRNPDLWSLKQDAIVAVWVDGEGTTLKHIKLDGDSVLLKPANQAYSARRVSPDQIQIQGVFIQKYRDPERESIVSPPSSTSPGCHRDDR